MGQNSQPIVGPDTVLYGEAFPQWQRAVKRRDRDDSTLKTGVGSTRTGLLGLPFIELPS